MKPTSLKGKLSNTLKKAGFTASTESKSRVKGLRNSSAGFKFRKMWDEYYLYYTCGNMAFRGMSIEKQNEKTREIYDWLVENGYGQWVKYVEAQFGGNDTITLVPTEDKEREI